MPQTIQDAALYNRYGACHLTRQFSQCLYFSWLPALTMKFFVYLLFILLMALFYSQIAPSGLYFRSNKIVMRGYNHRHNRSIDGGCAPGRSSTIRVHEKCVPGSSCGWNFTLRGPTAQLTLSFSGGTQVCVSCTGQRCPSPSIVTQSWPRLPYHQFLVEVLSFPTESLDTAWAAAQPARTDGLPLQTALHLPSGWHPSDFPPQQRHQGQPYATLQVNEGGQLFFFPSPSVIPHTFTTPIPLVLSSFSSVAFASHQSPASNTSPSSASFVSYLFEVSTRDPHPPLLLPLRAQLASHKGWLGLAPGNIGADGWSLQSKSGAL